MIGLCRLDDCCSDQQAKNAANRFIDYKCLFVNLSFLYKRVATHAHSTCSGGRFLSKLWQTSHQNSVLLAKGVRLNE